MSEARCKNCRHWRTGVVAFYAFTAEGTPVEQPSSSNGTVVFMSYDLATDPFAKGQAVGRCDGIDAQPCGAAVASIDCEENAALLTGEGFGCLLFEQETDPSDHICEVHLRWAAGAGPIPPR